MVDDEGDAADGGDDEPEDDALAAEWAAMADEDSDPVSSGGATRVLNQDEIDSLLGFQEGADDGTRDLANAAVSRGAADEAGRDDVELEDTIQEVFLEAHRGLHKLTDPKRLRPWLVTIAVRRSQKRIGKRVRRRALASAVGQAGPKCGDQREQARVNALYQALEQISEQLRVPWMLRNIEGYSLAETAEICGISVATVKRRLNRAQSRIDRRLEGGQGGR